MSSLCRWVLSHKRVVIGFGIVLTLGGIVAAGPASRALRIPVVTLPPGETVRSAAVRSELKRVDARLRAALPGARIASYAPTVPRALIVPGVVSLMGRWN